MKRSTGVVLGIAIVGVAVGVVYKLRSRGGGEKEHASDSAATSAGDSSRPRRHRDGDLPQGMGDAPVLVDDDPIGALRLEGQVLGEDDKPVAGAIVVLSANPARSAKTEGDGSFAFDKLVARPYTLVARAKAGVAGPVTAKLTAKSEPVILHLRPAGQVVVTVVDPKHKPVPGAIVELRGTDTQEAETEASGTATFAPVVPGGYDAVASAQGYARAHARVGVGEDKAEITLVLAHGAKVAGRVVDDQHAPVEGARVVFGGASDWSTRGDERLDGVVSNKDGRFEFAALPAGSWRFVARHPDHAPGTSALVTLDGATPRDGVEIRLPPGATVRGKVVDQQNAPVASARVRVGSAKERMIGEGPRQVYTDDRGEFIVRGLPRQPLLAIAMGDDAASDSVKLDASAGDVNDVVLKLDVTGTIAGTVVDEAGNALEGVQVSAFPDFRAMMGGGDPGGGGPGGGGRGGGGRGPGGGGGGRGGEMSEMRLRGFPEDLTDSSGHFNLTGLEPGTYRVRATRSKHAARGRGMAGEGQAAETGTKDLRIVLPPEGAVKGKVTYGDGSSPGPFTVSIGGMTQPIASSDGSFVVDGLSPQHYQVAVRGNGFVPVSAEVDVRGGQTADVGTLNVQKGRVIGGIVTSQGQPVPNATVYAGRQIMGNGSTANGQMGGMAGGLGADTRTTTTGDDGSFSMSGFGQADLTLVAEDPVLGRSLGVSLVFGDPNENNVNLQLQPYGALHGALTSGGKPAENVVVTAQSATAGNAIYSVASGPDGTYRFDQLAPDSYKVSAMIGMPRRGMKFYSQTVTVASGQDVALDLEYDPGAVTLDVTGNPVGGKPGFALYFIASGPITATTFRQLRQQLAAQGQGTSQMNWVPFGTHTTFTELDPGPYTVCAVAVPMMDGGRQAIQQYFGEYGDTLPVSLGPVVVTTAPTEQMMTFNVTVPPPPAGSGSGGSGSGGSGAPGPGGGAGGGSGSGAGSASGS